MEISIYMALVTGIEPFYFLGRSWRAVIPSSLFTGLHRMKSVTLARLYERYPILFLMSTQIAAGSLRGL